MARSIWASVTIRGGVRVRTLPMVVLKFRPRAERLVEHGVGRVGGRGTVLPVEHELGTHQAAPAAHVADQRMPTHHLPQLAKPESPIRAAFSTRCSSSMI